MCAAVRDAIPRWFRSSNASSIKERARFTRAASRDSEYRCRSPHRTNTKNAVLPCRNGMDYLRSGISLRQLRYLVAVTEAGSFSAAAQRTHVAQPALSRQVAMLEALVGSRLMQRSRNGITLTESGIQLYNLARGVLERLGSLHSELRSSEKRPGGVVTIALPPSIASMLVPRLVRELERRYPQIVLRVEDGLSPENGQSLQAALIDFGIVPAADVLVDVDYELLLRESMLLVERRDAAHRVPQTVTLAQVARRRLALPPRTFHTRRVIDDAARAAHLTLDIAYEQRSVTTIVSLVREGLAATITSSPSIEQFWKPGDVRARRIVSPQITRTISLARPSNRSLGFAAQAVYDIVKRLALEAVGKGRWQGKAL
jgi:LysR family transcriptional regulator, nitrogen assimilation regulatory protein